MSKPSPDDPVVKELAGLDAELPPILNERDSAYRLLELLPTKYQPSAMAVEAGARAWELVGLWFLNTGRAHEALALFWRLYLQMVAGQDSARINKGLPLVWLSECYDRLGCPLLAKRYLMLTLCEDALRESGTVSPNTTGAYFRLVWRQGLSDLELRRYAKSFFDLAQTNPEEAKFPEGLLQQVDDRWQTEAPSAREFGRYVVSPARRSDKRRLPVSEVLLRLVMIGPAKAGHHEVSGGVSVVAANP